MKLRKWKERMSLNTIENVARRLTLYQRKHLLSLRVKVKLLRSIISKVRFWQMIVILALTIAKDMNFEYIPKPCLNQQFKYKKQKSHLQLEP